VVLRWVYLFRGEDFVRDFGIFGRAGLVSVCDPGHV